MPHLASNAIHDSTERRDQQLASLCAEHTRVRILDHIRQWARGDTGPPICWLSGYAGTGKSTIADTIATERSSWIPLTFFFSRGKDDRDSLKKLVPTLAYQLAQSIPSLSPFIEECFTQDPLIMDRALGHQLRKLIFDPIANLSEPHLRILIIIDGMDECRDPQEQVTLIRQLSENTSSEQQQLCLLLTSRPEDQIDKVFKLSTVCSKFYPLRLQDYEDHREIRHVLVNGFEEIRSQHNDILPKLPYSWPSRGEIDRAVSQSQAVFIYVSTLLKFVGADDDYSPQEKLQKALNAHAGLDAIYDQVLSAAKGKDSKTVLATIILLQRPLSITALGKLMGWQSTNIRIALRGYKSILTFSGSDDNKPVFPFHASLGDFLVDQKRSEAHFIHDTTKYQRDILFGCIWEMNSLTSTTIQTISDPLSYACRYWAHHMGQLDVLTVRDMKAVLNEFMGKLIQEWIVFWLVGLEEQEITCQEIKGYLYSFKEV